MDYWKVMIGLLIVAVLSAIMLQILRLVLEKNVEKELSDLKDFTVTRSIIGASCDTGLAIDEHRQKICLLDYRLTGSGHRVFPFSDVLSAEIFQDGASVTKTVRSSQLAGVLIGGLVFGGVGAVVGGLSGSRRTHDTTRRIELRLLVNDTATSIHDVCFLEYETKKDSFSYRDAIQRAREWHGLIEVLMNRADAK